MTAANIEWPELVGVEGPVAMAHSFDLGDVADLWPGELDVVANAVPARRTEFAAGRACARSALRRIGAEPVSIVPVGTGPYWARRAPRWPDQVVGSLTHTTGYAAAVAGRRPDVVSLGLDAERNDPLPDGILEHVSLSVERTRVAGLSPGAGVAWDRLLFSAKEAVFKAWFFVERSWLGFEECQIDLREEGTFSAWLPERFLTTPAGRLSHLDGRWFRVERDTTDVLVTLVVVRGRGAPTRARQG